MITKFEQGTLVSENEWKNYIETLESKQKPSIKEEVKKAILEAVRKRIPQEHFGIFFSGGIDSTLIAFLCKKNNANFTCYSVGLENSPDIIEGKRVAEVLGFNLKQKICSIKECNELFKKIVKIFEKPDTLNVGVGSVILAAAELAKKDNVKIFFGGLGSEEIFAGYERHLLSEDPHRECWNGLKNMWSRDLIRDSALGKFLNIKVLIPFLDEDLMIKAMGIPSSKKINKEHKKIILREIAEELGIPKEFSWRQKKAAQYGSWFDKAMEKLTKLKDFKTKQEYINNISEVNLCQN